MTIYCCGFETYQRLTDWLLGVKDAHPDVTARLDGSDTVARDAARKVMNIDHPEVNFIAWRRGRNGKRSQDWNEINQKGVS